MENCKKRFAINIFLLLKITEILCKMFLIESRNFMKDTNKIKVCFVLLLIAVLVTLTGCGSQDLTKGEIAKYDYANFKDSNEKISFEETDEITNYVKIVTNRNKVILLELYPEIAPVTVKNFQKLVSEQFYDGLIFHRVIQNFMIQGGDPNGTGTGGSGETIQGEFSSNGVKNDLKHTEGVLSMARGEEPNTASSQFFICVATYPSLDGEYAAFGKVIAGYDTVKSISKVNTNAKDKPTKEQSMKTIRFVKITES